MAGTILLNSSYGVTTPNPDEVDSKNVLKKGWYNVSLNATPEIEANSVVDVDGVLYAFDADEAITGSPADGDVYVKVIASGSSITAEWTDVALPDYDFQKKGYYNGAGERYIAKYSLAATVYTFVYMIDYTIGTFEIEIQDFEDRNAAFWSFI